ncbi:hypothetical protein HY285_00245, partial [Candidatus Peregrinibacteria bacterium]|nr:hypothetical protein [Candidatus Peregrinibacteria bacterium]
MPEVWYLKGIRGRDEEVRRLKQQNERLKEKNEDLAREIVQLKDELNQAAMAKQAKKPHFPD